MSRLFWLFGARTALGVVHSIVVTVVLNKLRDSESFESIMSTMHTIDIASSALFILLGIGILSAYATLAGARRQTRPLFTLAILCAVFDVVWSMLWMLSAFDKHMFGPGLGEILIRAYHISTVVEVAVVVAALYRMSRKAGGNGALALGVPAVACRLVSSGLYFLLTFKPDMISTRIDNPWLWQGMMLSLSIGIAGFMMAMIKHVEARLDPESRPAEGDCWRAGARGLGLFASALHARIWLALAGVVLLMFAVFSRSIGMVKLVAVGIPLASTATAGAMVWGLLKFRVTPRPDSVRTSLGAAIAIFAVAFCVELTTVVQIVTAFGDPSALVGMEGRMSLDVVLQVMVLIGFVIVVSAMTRVADHLGRAELAAKSGTLYFIIIGVFGIAAVLRYATLQGELVRDLATAAVLLIGVAIAMVVAVVKFASVAREVAYAMEDQAAVGGAPARAIVVNADDNG